MDPNAKEIRPAIELDNLLVWDEASLPEYPSGENILVENNSEVFLNFYYTISCNASAFSQGGTVTNKITKLLLIGVMVNQMNIITRSTPRMLIGLEILVPG